MRQVIDFAARRLSVAATAYYHFGVSITDDANFDELSVLVAAYWDNLSPFFKEVFESPEAIRTTAHHIYINERTWHGTLHELRRLGYDEPINVRPFTEDAMWEDPENPEITQRIMSLGG